MKSHFLIIFLATLCLLATGCNRNCAVSGKITYTDGTPVPGGTIIFSTEVFQAKGPIQKDGSYVLGSVEINDGIPKGVYNVHFASSMLTVPTTTFDEKTKKATTVVQTTKLVDDKYVHPKESGITCEIKGGMTFDFSVDPPSK